MNKSVKLFEFFYYSSLEQTLIQKYSVFRRFWFPDLDYKLTESCL